MLKVSTVAIALAVTGLLNLSAARQAQLSFGF